MQAIFDTHAHYDHPRFDADRDELLASLPRRGVGLVVNVGSDKKSCKSSVALAERYEHIYASVGIHPHDATTLDDNVMLMLERSLSHPKVVALGEIGLDYYYDHSPRDIQREAFERQLKLALELDKPVIIHSREATQDTYALLKRYRPRGIIHCFSSSVETAREYVKLGFYIGFTGVVTFNNAKKSLLAAAEVPLERLLLETDCPYMAPEPHRGKRCDSTMLSRTAAALAAVKDVDAESLVRQCCENGKAVYGIE